MSVDAPPRTPRDSGEPTPIGGAATPLTTGNGLAHDIHRDGAPRHEAAVDIAPLAGRPAGRSDIPELDTPVDRHRRPRKLLRWACMALASLIVVVFAGFGYLYWQISRIPRIDTGHELDRRGLEIVPAGGLQVDTVAPIALPGGDVVPAGSDGTAPGLFTISPPDTTGPASAGSPTTTATAAGAPDATVTIAGATAPVTTAVPVTVPNDPNTVAGASEYSGAAPIDPESATPTTAVGGAQIATAGVDPLGTDDAFNLLILGTDSRDGLTGGSAKDAGQGKVSGNRPDSLMVLRIDPKTHQAWTLSIPRDLWVRVDGTGTWDRINAAYSGKQPAARMIRTIRGNLGIPINHVMVANFAGFQKLIATVGGVNLCFGLPSRDIWTGLNQGQGCHLLDERQALAFARSRHFEEFRKGKWTPDGKGDLGRIVRQQAFLRASLKQAVDKGAGNPLTLNAMLANANDAVAIDDSFGIREIAQLAQDLRSYDPDKLQGFTIPVGSKRIGNKEVLLIKAREARPIVGQFGHAVNKPAK